LVVVLALGDRIAGVSDALGQLAVEQTELSVHSRGRGLDASQPPDDRARDRLAGDGKILDRFHRLVAPELARWSVTRDCTFHE
jgi:hypothetical protein